MLYVTIVVIVLGVVGLIIWQSRRAGRSAERVEIANKVIHAAEVRSQVEVDNSQLSDDDLRAKLRNKKL